MNAAAVARALAGLSFPACVALAFALQLPLVANVGFFSHDELQYLALADVDTLAALPWFSFLDLHAFQYRPLNFNLWMLLNRLSGGSPYLLHAVGVGLGSLNAALLRRCAIACGATPLAATCAAGMFLVFPYAVYVHAWVAALADQLVLAYALLTLTWLLRERPAAPLADAVVGAAATGVALLTKESAIVFPALLLAAWPRRGRTLWPAVAASAAVVALYLALRLDTILYAPRSAGGYGWSLAYVPRRIVEYFLFPFVPRVLEPEALRWSAGHVLWPALLGGTLALAALVRAGGRTAAIVVVGWLACLGPVLILERSVNVYAYLATAYLCTAFAVRWPQVPRLSRGLLLAAALLAGVHGLAVAWEMLRVGRVQARLYADLEALLPAASAAAPLQLKPRERSEDYIVQRVLHEVPAWRRVPVAQRVVALRHDDTTPPTHWVAHDGRLESAGIAP